MNEGYDQNVLLVEGASEQRLLPELLEKNGIVWPKGNEPVDIRPFDGVENLLKPDVISAELKASKLQALGLILDANDSLERRWQALRNRVMPIIPAFPQAPRDGGLVLELDDKIRFGVWMMPDNQSSGMMETFLGTLVKDSDDTLWNHAEAAAMNAKENFGARFRDSHVDKARIHTFLAWSDPPGRQLHEAIMHKVLDPRSPRSKPFVKWFRELYRL